MLWTFRKTKQNYSFHLADGIFFSLTQAHATYATAHKGESKVPSSPCDHVNYLVFLAAL